MELEEEELVAPVRPQRITRNMRSGELLKLQRETSKAILSHLIYDMDEKESESTVRYEGDSAAYRLWERAVISATEGIDYDNLERIIKYDEIDEYGDDDWNLWYTPKDRRFLYRILMDTLSPAAKDIVERQDITLLMTKLVPLLTARQPRQQALSSCLGVSLRRSKWQSVLQIPTRILQHP